MLDNFNTRDLSLSEKAKLKAISLFRKHISYKVNDLYVKDLTYWRDITIDNINVSEFDILVKIGKPFKYSGPNGTYESSYFWSLKSGEYYIYDWYSVKELRSYLSIDKEEITYEEALSYCEKITDLDNRREKINRLFILLWLSIERSDLEENLHFLKKELPVEELKKQAYIQIYYSAEDIFRCYYNLINYYYNKDKNTILNEVKYIKRRIKFFETIKNLISENKKSLKEYLISFNQQEILEYIHLVKIINANLDYILKVENCSITIPEENMSTLKKILHY